MPIRVIIADDHAVYREAVCRMLQTYPCISVLGQATSAEEAIRLVRQFNPDIAVIDVRMAGMSGLEAISVIREQPGNTCVLIMSVYDDKQYVVQAVKAGARGYLIKDASAETLVEAIRLLHAGELYFSPSVSGFAHEALRQRHGAGL